MTLSDEQQKLKTWMEEYALYRLLDEPGEGVPGTLPDFSAEPPPAAGQIRLWPAVLHWPPMYGLLMRGAYGYWRVFPFSELSVPAVPGELKVRSTPPVRVIEGWNARELPQARVLESWVVASLPEPMLFRIHLWDVSLRGDGDLPADTQALTGPPLRHPLDPRHAYLESEQARAESCLGEGVAPYRTGEEEKKAAEPESGYGVDNENDPSV